jgi:hypothetical protein
MLGQFVIVRSREQGVVCGVLEEYSGRCVKLSDARQVHSWQDGANTLFEMSRRGCGTARISEPVETILILEACGIIPCTPEAEENLRQSRWNKPYARSASRPRATKQTAS